MNDRSTSRSVDHLQELSRVAEQAGFDAQAAICCMQITDQLLEKPPDALKMFDSDPKTGEMTNTEIPHCDVAYRYLVQPREAKLATRLQAIGTDNLHELSGACMSTFSEYYAFFRACIDA